MADIDAIRRKHEAQVAYTKEKQGDFSYLFQSIQSNLRISDVDSLFAALDSLREEASLYQKEWAKLRAALDEAKDGLTAAHMHGFEEGRDQYRDKVRKLQDALDAERGRIYPCADCGKMRTKEEGGTTFTVCDECWDKRFDKKGNK